MSEDSASQHPAHAGQSEAPDDLIASALLQTAESSTVEFKSAFDPTSPGAWVELIKDIVAFANSGGGTIVIGLEDDGTPAVATAPPIIDSAEVTDKIYRYTSAQLSSFSLHRASKAGGAVLALIVNAVEVPLVFTSPGTYEVDPEPPKKHKQHSAFPRGSLYFRHGAKSEPATPDDLRAFVERRLEVTRKAWLEGIAKVVEAPAGARVVVVPAGDLPADSSFSVRLVDDPNAPAYQRPDIDALFPYRQKELVQELNAALAGGRPITGHDIQCVRRAHQTDARPEWSHKARYTSRQYSDAFRDWILHAASEDPAFFDRARAACRRPPVQDPPPSNALAAPDADVGV